MKNFLKQFVANKKILILGFGREGKSTFNILQSVNSYSELAISDLRPVELEGYDDVKIFSGENHLEILDDYDIVFKSPGIVLPKDYTEYSCCINSQTELFLKYYAQQTIGITGTKGKSTTSSLLYHVLKDNGCDCILAGNIGMPVFDTIDDISKSTIIVFEMSCHQLEHIGVSPATAVFLNLFEDHLDHYGTFEKYSYAKKNIYRYQKDDDILFCNPVNAPLPSDCISHICYIDPEKLPDKAVTQTKLKGKHNRFNIAVVYEICKHLNLDETGILSSLSTFAPLAHRLEYIGKIGDVEYYDDSISTTAESTISAITSIENAGTVLIGGMDRGIDYSSLIDFLLKCTLDEVIFMYDSGKRIYDVINESISDKSVAAKFVYAQDLETAVDYARKATEKGKACILSPAAASYGVFKNFEERGNEFKRLLFNN